MFRRISVRLLIAAAALTSCFAAFTVAADARGYRLKLAATFQVPVPADAIQNGWCYDLAAVDPMTHRFYLADAANKQLSVIDPMAGFIGGIGTGMFTGIADCHHFNFEGQGPDGVIIRGNDIYAGNGNSHVLGFSLTTGRQIADPSTGGKLRADEMAVADRYLVVTNPAEKPSPYISVIDLRAKHHPVVARFTFTHATGGIEQPQFWHGHLYISIPTTTESPTGGEVDELDISNLHAVRIIHRFVFSTCQPAGLAVDEEGVAAVGCGGPSSHDQQILSLRTGKQTPVKDVPGVDMVAAGGGDFFYVSYAKQTFVVADRSGTVLQTFQATAASHTVVVDRTNGDVWVPQDKGVVNLYAPAS
ncbi:MAG: hypothetical protein M3018_04930 [Actinomycetota bacterium]|nr:hypothetical protein [Actinomycetota bacterium]